MADDWQIGDLALCVQDGRIKCPHTAPVVHTGISAPRLGSIRNVAHVQPSIVEWGSGEHGPCGCLRLGFTDGTLAVVQRCIKITPPEADEFDREVIELMRERVS